MRTSLLSTFQTSFPRRCHVVDGFRERVHGPVGKRMAMSLGDYFKLDMHPGMIQMMMMTSTMYCLWSILRITY